MAKNISISNKSRKLKKSRRYKKSRKNITYKLYGGEYDTQELSSSLLKNLNNDLSNVNKFIENSMYYDEQETDDTGNTTVRNDNTTMNNNQESLLQEISKKRYSCRDRGGWLITFNGRNNYCELIKTLMYFVLIRYMNDDIYNNYNYKETFFKKFREHAHENARLLNRRLRLLDIESEFDPFNEPDQLRYSVENLNQHSRYQHSRYSTALIYEIIHSNGYRYGKTEQLLKLIKTCKSLILVTEKTPQEVKDIDEEIEQYEQNKTPKGPNDLWRLNPDDSYTFIPHPNQTI